MKKLLSIAFLFAVLLSVAPVNTSAQTLTVTKLNGQTTITSTKGTRIPAFTNAGSVADTVRIAGTVTKTYVRIKNSGVEQYRFIYGISNDSLSGYTVLNFCRLLNQGYFRADNYLGAYKYSELVTPDTGTVGNYYYDTDSISFRVKRASGGFITFQTKN